ncbi:CBS domain-containing protein [Gilvimarinus algae]|uniref:CBS domain-containing protein n=1 Tax=Gilvimarinus algae TaxID=3058037 RepID=A0ABT8TAH5_9GAMM|nr:CBS domain-containing protein [Gilvimarinus sp. SDUM040014]MDO3381121.1 CBS domain-containing protein [Gilvimarinus sp. SDUM040014]
MPAMPTARELLEPDVLCAYEGWSLQRLEHFLMRHELARVPVIASDHQLVGSVGSADLHRLMNLEETYRARMINDNFRRSTGQDMDNMDELTQWTRRALVYCTVHQVMLPDPPHVEADDTLQSVRELLVAQGLDRVWVTDQGVLAGAIRAVQLL